MNSSSTEKKEIRKFGVIAFIFFGVLSALGIWRGKPVPTYLFGSISILGLCFILMPSRFRRVHEGWLSIAGFIGKVTNILILTLAYYLVITPAALLKRLFSGAPLPVKPDEQASTYWVNRNEPAQPEERFIKRY
jgi:hypothetical protein